jgi:cation diffusion facilitator CzcD-associated flavoprotein CzcO
MLPSRAPHALVVGGGYAGVLAANRLAHRLPAGHALTLLTEGDALLDRVRLHETLARGRTARIPLARLLHPRVRVTLSRARSIDRARRAVVTADGSILFDELLLAVGSAPSSPVPGVAAHAHGLRDEDRAMEAFHRLRALPAGAPVVVLGGSLTALETAAEIAEAHPSLTVVEREGASITKDQADEVVRQSSLALQGPLGVDACLCSLLAEAIPLHQSFELLLGFAVHQPDLTAQAFQTGFKQQRDHQHHSRCALKPGQFCLKALSH